ncbi:patatin-like phospholipase family protein [Brevundimonas subvibrioides]|uniref:Patatin n=1 Tax=Brevundimonas subvibrioides (strain ATCC 15264 / DSM 4735 / LMG 14903 / NBRC 16000 / CB 81) TaxID=633149 RepID=D9QNB9_BRESC|nr:patatin-like phospholipase family protein [Brevundimonas subvibrioides]ADL00320.1 Patatin [Brevundimonas subvibrioides ATCC 15264]
MIRRAVAIAGLIGALLAGGCQTVSRAAFTYDDIATASPDIRLDFHGPTDRERYVAGTNAAVLAARDGHFDLLALSGGGAVGAYGAGLLVGWTRRGDRPVFEVVTGVSTGAMIAPFAFIGSDGDAALQAAFTDGRSDRLLQARWAMSLVGPGLFRQRPLRDLVAASVTDDLLARVAEGHRAGRRLYVATTSLDTQGQVVWDMGALAASDRPNRREVFIDILTASASIPGVFPPVFVALEDDGHVVRELHADGRTTANFFIAPERLMLDPALLANGSDGRIWIAINGRPDARFSVASYSGVGVASRGLDTMMKASTRMSLVAADQFARLRGLSLSVAMAPVGSDNNLRFDKLWMQGLFDQGLQAGLGGEAWAGTPSARD